MEAHNHSHLISFGVWRTGFWPRSSFGWFQKKKKPQLNDSLTRFSQLSNLVMASLRFPSSLCPYAMGQKSKNGREGEKTWLVDCGSLPSSVLSKSALLSLLPPSHLCFPTRLFSLCITLSQFLTFSLTFTFSHPPSQSFFFCHLSIALDLHMSMHIGTMKQQQHC